MKSFFKRLIKWISEFSKYNLKIKYRKKSEGVVSNVIFRKSNLMEKISVNKIFFNVMMKEIDEQKWHIAMIKYIQTNIESKKILKKHIFNDRKNFRLNTENSNESILYKFLSNNIKETSYFEKLFRWNFLNKYHSDYKHLKFLNLLNIIKIRKW